MIQESVAYLTCTTSSMEPHLPDDDMVRVRSTSVRGSVSGRVSVLGDYADGPYTRHEVSDARELAGALDLYKLVHRRCYLTFEEVIGVLHSLGYTKQ
ncbi:MAG: hypothetical protein PHQ75_03025 [Thermoguttaceae bacterium]|nr:hypothetical protein [Thermoguttaceae bacterium]